MRPHFGEHGRALMVRNLQSWLELSKEKNMPTSLLLLSRAFTVTQSTRKVMGSMEEKIKETIGSLPDEVLEDVSLQSLAGRYGHLSKLFEYRKKYFKRDM
jgi:LETM1 and EF-hand domain-containing protein 1